MIKYADYNGKLCSERNPDILLSKEEYEKEYFEDLNKNNENVIVAVGENDIDVDVRELMLTGSLSSYKAYRLNCNGCDIEEDKE